MRENPVELRVVDECVVAQGEGFELREVKLRRVEFRVEAEIVA